MKGKKIFIAVSITFMAMVAIYVTSALCALMMRADSKRAPNTSELP